jgi:hypothetical protein
LPGGACLGSTRFSFETGFLGWLCLVLNMARFETGRCTGAADAAALRRAAEVQTKDQQDHHGGAWNPFRYGEAA